MCKRLRACWSGLATQSTQTQSPTQVSAEQQGKPCVCVDAFATACLSRSQAQPTHQDTNEPQRDTTHHHSGKQRTDNKQPTQ